ncbi:MAG: RNA polymerase sigma factor RpoE [Chlorobi bacterium OLB7]|nr:MAG: RNA polymerase sigma factor RpoE [Chlorobi bacterium OLB7]
MVPTTTTGTTPVRSVEYSYHSFGGIAIPLPNLSTGRVRYVAKPNDSIEHFEAEAIPHLNDLFRTASRMVGSVSDAEDVVQETYLQAWKSFHKFQQGTNCRAWLFAILFNKIRHYHRARSTAKVVAVDDEILAQVPTPEAVSAEHIRDEDILAALEKIPVGYREVILLADVQEFAYREIAEILEIPIGTVMSRLSRARGLLRTGLADVAKEYGIRVANSAMPPGRGEA